MSSASEAGLFFAGAAIHGWFAYRALRKGSTVESYIALDETRSGNPLLFWVDFGLTATIALVLFAVGIWLTWQSI